MRIDKAANEHFYEFVFDWASKYYLLVGGYGSSKSYHVALKLILKLQEERRTCLVVREVYDTIRDSCYSLFREISAGLNLPVEFMRSPLQMQFANGSRIIFRGLDKPEKLKSINDVSIIWVEECSEIKYAGFKELTGRLRHPTQKLHMILSTNPVSKANWVYEHFFERRHLDDRRLYRERVLRLGDTYYHHSRALDNAYLPSEYLAELEQMKHYDEDLYRVAWLGEFGVEGLKVLPQFEVQTSVEVLKAVSMIASKYKFVGMDFGFEESYNAVIRLAVDDANKWLYIYWEYYANHMTDDETADALEEFVRTREVIKADSAEPKAIKYYQKRGFNMIGARKWSGGSRHARLDNTRKVKRFKRIICSDACLNVIKELSDLTYAKDRDGHVIADEFNRDAHTFSAIWYALDNYEVAEAKHHFKREDFGL